MKHMVFGVPVAGRLYCQSPDRRYCAYVLQSTTLHLAPVDDYELKQLRLLNGRGKSGAGSEDTAAGNGNSHDRVSSDVRHPETDSVVSSVRPSGSYVGLDEITDLCWSPNSALLAVVMAKRSCIEVLRISDIAIVARIDGTVGDLKVSMWNPQSTCLFWFGRQRSFLLRIEDSFMHELEPGICVQTRESVPESVRAQHPYLNIEAASSLFSSNPCVPLARFSPCGKYLYTVSQRRVLPAGRSEDSLSTITSNLSSSAASKVINASKPKEFIHSMLTIRSTDNYGVLFCSPAEALGGFQPMPTPGQNSHATSHSQQQQPRHSTAPGGGVAPSGSGKENNSFQNNSASNSTGLVSSSAIADYGVRQISDLIVTNSAIVLHDRHNGNVVLLSTDGRTLLYPKLTGRGILAIDVSPGGRSIALLSSDRCYIVIGVSGRYFELSSVPLKPAFLPRNTPLLTEVRVPVAPEGTLHSSQGPDAMRYLLPHQATPQYSLELEWEVSSFDRYAKEVVLGDAGLTPITPDMLGIASSSEIAAVLSKVKVSSCGSFVAVVPAALPSCVFIIDALRGIVHSVLRHRQMVSSAIWIPAAQPTPKGRRLSGDTMDLINQSGYSLPAPNSVDESRHAVGEQSSTASVGRNSRGEISGANIQPQRHELQRLAVSTENHDGCLFLWQPDAAMVVAVPNLLTEPDSTASNSYPRGTRLADRPCKCKSKQLQEDHGGAYSSDGTPVPTVRGVPIGFRSDHVEWLDDATLLLVDRLRGTAVTGVLLSA